MRPHLLIGTQSSLAPLLLILLSNLSMMKADSAHTNEARSESGRSDLFPAFSVDRTAGMLNSVSNPGIPPFLASKESARTGNATESDDDIIVSDEPEGEGEDDYSYDQEEEEEEEEDDEDEFEEEEEDEEDDEEEEEEEEEEDESFRAEVRSLSDLPLSKLLQVRGELQRFEEDEVAETRAMGNKQPSLANVATATTAALGAAAAAAFNSQRNKPHVLPNIIPPARLSSPYPLNSPSEKKKTADPGDSKDVPPRRGGWHFEEEEQNEEHEEDHSWLSNWHKGKKKKGDIGSVFQLSVTFLAFLAFGGYLLCLIVQAVKGGGPTGPSGDAYRPAMTPMVLVMPSRLGVRRPRPPNPGRRRRRKRRRRRDASNSPDEDVPWPTWSDAFEAEGSGRLWPNVDPINLQRVLFEISRELAENGRNLQ